MIADHYPATAPAPAVWLGALGAIPFAALAVAISVGPPGISGPAGEMLRAYGAIILSFMGGVQWGLACRDRDGLSAGLSLTGMSAQRLALSVLPALFAWGALFLPASIGMALSAGAFGLVLFGDIRATRAGAAPAWYPRLRWPLTVVVMSALALGALSTA